MASGKGQRSKATRMSSGATKKRVAAKGARKKAAKKKTPRRSSFQGGTEVPGDSKANQDKK